MQLYALNFKEEITFAGHALRQTDYFCLECHETVRVRGGPHRRRHFYHLDPEPSCRQNQKGAVHLELQSHLLRLLPQGECRLECPFPSIGRIADAAWMPRKIVFEIQCSPISQEEVMARNRDYAQEGWSVVWILHDRRYNQVRLSAAEIALRPFPHYFSNMDEQGSGIVYDQFDICKEALRCAKLPPLTVNLCTIREKDFSNAPKSPLALIEKRRRSWNLSMEGDLESLYSEDPSNDYLKRAMDLERKFGEGLHANSKGRLVRWIFKLGERLIVNPYQIFFRFLLERMCR